MREELEDQSDTAIRFVSSDDGAIALVRSRFRAFEGALQPTRFTKIGLNIGRTSHMYRKSDAGELDATWRRNGISVNLPNDSAVGSSGAVTMIGLAIDFDALGLPQIPLTLEPLVYKLTVDTLASNYMRRLFDEAELHGTSRAFFDHSLDTLMARLCSDLAPALSETVPPLDACALKIVQEIVEARLSQGLSVIEMAAAVNMPATRFAKSFKSSTGLAPFQYLTARRMARAKLLLSHGMNVTQTASAVGYANPSKFSSAFRKFTGVKPSECLNN